MEQISLPYRIALGALLVVAALWFTVLKPGNGTGSTPAPTTAPGAAGLGRAVSKAKGAVATSQASAARSEAAAGQARAAGPGKTATKVAPRTAGQTKKTAITSATATPAQTLKHVRPTKTVPGAATKPSPSLIKADGGKDPSAPLVADLNRGRTLVLLFWNKKGSDDQAVRAALKGVGSHHGKVVVKAIPSKDVGNYEAITRGAQVLQSPTVLVIGKDKKAHAIVGFTYTGEIDQLVGDVLAGRAG
ncbi:MAG: hypothetical protein ACXVFL_06975 [Solirubrobacteraceae bacterium]